MAASTVSGTSWRVPGAHAGIDGPPQVVIVQPRVSQCLVLFPWLSHQILSPRVPLLLTARARHQQWTKAQHAHTAAAQLTLYLSYLHVLGRV